MAPTLATMLTVTALTPAISVLAVDTSRLGWSRRRRAIAALIATGWASGEFDTQVTALGGRPSDIRNAVNAAHPNTVASSLDDLERWIFNLEDAVMFGPSAQALAKCWQKEPGNYVDFATGSRTLVIGSAASVPASAAWGLQQVKESVDPQQWDTCSGFWPDGGTYLMAATAPPWTPPSPPDPLQNPPGPGNSWPFPSFLFEHFLCSQGCSAEYKIVLATSVEMRGTVHTVTYRLADAGVLSGTIGSNDVKPIIDQGNVEVWQNAPSKPVYVTARKELELDSDSANLMAYWALLNYEKERGLGELACCMNN